MQHKKCFHNNNNWNGAPGDHPLSACAPLLKGKSVKLFYCLPRLTKLTMFSLCMAAHQAQQTAQSAKHIKMLRIDEGRWSIVYFKYLIFIYIYFFFFAEPPNRLAHVGRRGVCLLARVCRALHTCLLVCFINGNHLSKCFSKTPHQDFMAKTIYFSWHIWISLLNNMAAFIFH